MADAHMIAEQTIRASVLDARFTLPAPPNGPDGRPLYQYKATANEINDLIDTAVVTITWPADPEAAGSGMTARVRALADELERCAVHSEGLWPDVAGTYRSVRRTLLHILNTTEAPHG